MTWTRSSVVRSSITKIAVAGVLIGIPAAAVGIPAYAAPDLRSAPTVLSAPLPAEPPTNELAPPPPPPPGWAPPGSHVHWPANSAEDYWDYWYNLGADGGGGGGGGG
jgi:hypothetical protein